MTNWQGAIAAVLIFGVCSICFGEVVFLFFVFGIICLAVYKNTDRDERRFVITVLIAGFLVRVICAALFHGANFLKGYHGISGDDLLYTVKSWGLVHKWEGRSYAWVYDLAGSSPKYGLNPFVYVLAAFYKVFGFHPVSSKIINAIFGVLIGWVAYLLAGEISGRRAGRATMFLITFWPSLLRWSIANLKDPMILFFFMTCVYVAVVVAVRATAVWQLLIFGVCAFLLYLFTPILYFALATGCFIMAVGLRVYGHIRSVRLRRGAALAVIIGVIVAGCYYVASQTSHLVSFLYLLQEKQELMAKADYAGYYFYPGPFIDKLSVGVIDWATLAVVVFANTVYFLLTPFPWQYTSLERMFALPQMIVWYAILALSCLGFARLAIEKRRFAVLMGFLVALGVLASAMAEGNIGSAFRHRDIFVPFFVVIAAGMWDRLDADTHRPKVKGCA